MSFFSNIKKPDQIIKKMSQASFDRYVSSIRGELDGMKSLMSNSLYAEFTQV